MFQDFPLSGPLRIIKQYDTSGPEVFFHLREQSVTTARRIAGRAVADYEIEVAGESTLGNRIPGIGSEALQTGQTDLDAPDSEALEGPLYFPRPKRVVFKRPNAAAGLLCHHSEEQRR